MNVENILKVKAWLDAGAPERKFNMQYFYDGVEETTNWCGTSCCIAGYIYSILTPFEDRIPATRFDTFTQIGADFLGLDWNTAHELFFPSDYDVTPEDASAALQNILNHGEPRWTSILGY